MLVPSPHRPAAAPAARPCAQRPPPTAPPAPTCPRPRASPAASSRTGASAPRHGWPRAASAPPPAAAAAVMAARPPRLPPRPPPTPPRPPRPPPPWTASWPNTARCAALGGVGRGFAAAGQQDSGQWVCVAYGTAWRGLESRGPSASLPAGRRGRHPHVALAAAHRDGARHDGGQEAAAVRGGWARVGVCIRGRRAQRDCAPVKACLQGGVTLFTVVGQHTSRAADQGPHAPPAARWPSASTLSLRTSCTACSTTTTPTSSSCASGERTAGRGGMQSGRVAGRVPRHASRERRLGPCAVGKWLFSPHRNRVCALEVPAVPTAWPPHPTHPPGS